MAKFNDLLASRYAEAARRLLGEDISIDSVAPELLLTLSMEGDDPELSFLKSELLLGAAGSQPLNAAQTSCFQIRNPPNSGIILVLEEIEAAPGAATNVEVGILFNQPDLGTLISNITRDTRIADSGGTVFQGQGIVSRANNILSVNPIARADLQADVTWVWRTPIVLSPNWSVRVTTINNNIILNVGFRWRERRFRPEEQR